MSDRTDQDPQNAWQRHSDEQALAWLRRSPAERLAWLEEAKKFVAKFSGTAQKPQLPENEDEP